MGHAQDDAVKSLGEILNQPIQKDDEGIELTPKILANKYYEQCVAEKSFIFDDEELNLLCTCTSANMSRTLTVEEFQDLEKDTTAGKIARGTMLAFAYSPCMKPVVQLKTKKDCAVSSQLDDIVVGKRHVCSCAVKMFDQFMDSNIPQIVTEAVYQNKMELNPLKFFYSEWPYHNHLKQYITQCVRTFRYEQANQR
ncbi:MAG: hypothetical protein GC137_01925 [Alphaproteobacteria bacterium]|nr:hypothetical protein [Alphaproteobacteria bacterium]